MNEKYGKYKLSPEFEELNPKENFQIYLTENKIDISQIVYQTSDNGLKIVLGSTVMNISLIIEGKRDEKYFSKKINIEESINSQSIRFEVEGSKIMLIISMKLLNIKIYLEQMNRKYIIQINLLMKLLLKILKMVLFIMVQLIKCGLVIQLKHLLKRQNQFQKVGMKYAQIENLSTKEKEGVQEISSMINYFLDNQQDLEQVNDKLREVAIHNGNERVQEYDIEFNGSFEEYKVLIQ